MKYNYFSYVSDLRLFWKEKHLFQNIRLLLISIFLSLTFVAKVQAADIIVNYTVPAYRYSVNDVRAIFMMRMNRWSNGQFIRVFVLSDNHPVHDDFAKNNLGLFPHQLRSFWNRLVFSGTGQAPMQVNSVDEMLRMISITPYSIGYVDHNPNNIPGVRSLTY